MQPSYPPHVERCWLETGSPHMTRGGGGDVIDLAGLTVAGNQAVPRMWRGAGSSRAPPIMRRANGGNIVGLMGLMVVGLPNLTREVVIHREDLIHGGWGSRRRIFAFSL
jgi:hypothetical protein